ncbi:MAG: Gfo/Idh/MocA family oxidoreductase, partial [Clostridia bacterium]|nr:Gfo/Idh/MocA family oxidoreductase [Clostridia bacterium]
MAKKNAVVIGFGGMGGWHCHFQRSNDVVNLKGVYDIKPERNQAAKEIGIYAYPSFEAVLADPEVDFLVIAVPNDMHKPLAIAAMEAGKHV